MCLVQLGLTPFWPEIGLAGVPCGAFLIKRMSIILFWMNQQAILDQLVIEFS
jgi:hypothetical protein